MVLKRQLAALIWAAAVIVAAQFLPSIAHAHAGHDHASYSAAATHGGAAVLSDHHIADPTEAERAAALTELAAVDFNTMPAGPAGGCNGACCGTGNACCGAILLFSSVSLPDFSAGRQPVGSASSAPPGIDPDALRKPPKSLA